MDLADRDQVLSAGAGHLHGSERGRLFPLLLGGAAVAGIFWNATALCDNVHVACWDHYRIGARMAWLDAMPIVYMLIGSVFYAHHRRLVSTWQAVAGVLFLFACYQLCVSASPLPVMTTGRRLPYLWGLSIFAFSYLLRERIVLTRPLRFLADISYSLYMLHALLGSITIRLLMAAGLPYVAVLHRRSHWSFCWRAQCITMSRRR